jgi:DNA-binding CsgD family transcriptional regulator
MDDGLAAARSAFEAGDWETARERYEAVWREEGDPRGLDGLGEALWFIGDLQGSLAAREQAYAELRREGDTCAAAAIALWLAVEHESSSVSNGWFRRADRLLAGEPLCREHVELEVLRGRHAANAVEARAHYERAAEIGRGFGDPDAEIRGLTQVGVLAVAEGSIEEGMSILDECMAAALGGELRDPWMIGGAACQMLVACDRIADYKRAAEWCRVVVDFTERRRYTPLAAWCRTIYAGVLITTGEWDRAERELLAALETYEDVHAEHRIYALGVLADLRVRQGRFEEAAELVAGHEEHGLALPAVAALHLARGEGDVAAARLARRLEAVGGDASHAAALLPLLVRALLAAGDVDGAAAASDRLAKLGRPEGRENLSALALLARGRIGRVSGDDSAAIELQEAAERLGRLGMPLEEARARLELARALGASQADLAVASARAALKAFERLGALRDADEAAECLRALGASGRSAPRQRQTLTKREDEVLALLGRGLSNAEIAARLVISPKTAEHHVGRILSKLGLRGRAEAAAYAVRASAERSGAK